MPRPPGCRATRTRLGRRNLKYMSRFGAVLVAFLSFYMSLAEALPAEEVHLPTKHAKQVEEMLDVHTEVTYPAKSALSHAKVHKAAKSAKVKKPTKAGKHLKAGHSRRSAARRSGHPNQAPW